MELSCQTRKHKDIICDCFEFECNTAQHRSLWIAEGINACGTFTINVAKSCGSVIIAVNFESVATLTEGESITLTVDDINRITVICQSPQTPPGVCKINFTFQPIYSCC